jgi:hypothetical protein
MRRLAKIASIVGAAAFAALLAWGLTFGAATAQDDETPVADETPEFCGPVFPTTFAGTVTVDAAPAADGTVISAIGSDGVTWATASTSGGSYSMDVPATMPVTEPCFPGGEVSFTCDGAAAAETGSATGGLKDLNLTCAAVAPPVTPTVEPTPTEEPTVEPTPTVLPPTGMGGMSGDGGFMWWPLALAAAAFTSVAGVLTARWARR